MQEYFTVRRFTILDYATIVKPRRYFLRCLHDCLALQNRQGNTVTTHIYMFLSKQERTILGQEIRKHASKDATIDQVLLLRGIVRARNKLPLIGIWKRSLFLVHVFVSNVAKNGIQEFNARVTL